MRKKNIVTPNSDEQARRQHHARRPSPAATRRRRSSSAPIDEHHARAEHQADRLGVAVEHLVELRDLRRDRHRGEEADEHRRAAERRHRLRVHVPRVGAARRRRRTGSRASGRAASAASVVPQRDREDDRVAPHGSLPPARDVELWVRRELRAEAVGLRRAPRRDALVVGARAARGRSAPRSRAISVGAHARGRDRGGAEPQPARDERLLGVVRDRVLVAA